MREHFNPFPRRPLVWPAATVFFALVGILLLFSGCTIDPTPPDRYAIVYGVSNYPGTVNDLNYTDDDASDLAAALSAKGFTVFLRLTDDTDSDATKTNLLTDFSTIVADLDENDLLLFYFSGHGGQMGTTDLNEDQFADSDAEAIIFSDGTSPTTIDDYLLDNELYGLISQSPAGKNVIIIDACNSGGFIGQEYDFDASSPEYSSTDAKRDSVISSTLEAFFAPDTGDIPPSDAILITAAGELEVSWESGYYGHGIFTYALLNALNDGDYNRDGYIDTSELYHYAREFIEVFWNAGAPGNEDIQFLPHISGGPVDYVLCEAD